MVACFNIMLYSKRFDNYIIIQIERQIAIYLNALIIKRWTDGLENKRCR